MYKELVKYLYIVVIAGLIVTTIYFLISLGKLGKNALTTNNKLKNLNKDIDKTKSKVDEISKSRDSYEFFITIYGFISLIKGIFSFKKNKPTAKTIAKTVVKGAKQINKII